MATVTRAVAVVIALLVITSCSSARKRLPDPAVSFAPVRTIELKDATDPVLLASTSASRVREYIEIGLKGRGYAVCRDCQADAVATVTVDEYFTRQDSKRNLLTGDLAYFDVAQIYWSFAIVRNGETVFQKTVNRTEPRSINELTGVQVRDMLEDLPARR